MFHTRHRFSTLSTLQALPSMCITRSHLFTAIRAQELNLLDVEKRYDDSQRFELISSKPRQPWITLLIVFLFFRSNAWLMKLQAN
jgi:hypothetical protein